MPVNKKQFAVNSLWKILEQFASKGVSLIVTFVLSRILLPDDFGLITLTAVFTNLSDILIDGGFSTALIRKEHVDELDYAAAFTINSSMAVLLYIILFLTAPLISDYYNTPELTSVLRVLGLVFFVQSFASVRNSIINRNMQFKLLFFCNMVACILSGIAGIIFACCGFGVWSLVIQRLLQMVILNIVLFIKVKWKISLRLDIKRVKSMLKFSLGVVGASLLNFAGGNIYSLAIGKKYSVSDLGYYDKAGQLPMQFSLYTFGAMSNVLLPTLSSCQTDIERVKAIVRKVVKMTSFLIMPMMVGLALVSKEAVVLFFSDIWIPAIPMMYATCLYYLATPYMLINVQVFFALGRSGLRVKTEVIRLTLMTIGLIIFGFVMDCSVIQLAWVSGVIAVLVSAISFYEVGKIISYKISDAFQDVWKALVATLVMGGLLVLFENCIIIDNLVLSLICKGIIGFLTYLGMCFILKIPELNDVVGLIKRKKSNE